MSDTSKKPDALAILAELLPQIELNHYQSPESRRDQDWFKSVPDTITRLKNRIQEGPPRNPRYSDTAELAAELVYVGYHHPTIVQTLFSNIDKRPDEIEATSAYGLCRIADIHSLICDDHEYCLDPQSQLPKLKMQHEIGTFVPLVGVTELLQSVRGQRIEAEQIPTDEPTPMKP